LPWTPDGRYRRYRGQTPSCVFATRLLNYTDKHPRLCWADSSTPMSQFDQLESDPGPESDPAVEP